MRRAAAILIPLIVAACSAAQSSEASEAKDVDMTAVSRDFDLAGFEQVRLMGSDDVRIVEGESFAISATGPRHVIDRLDLKVEGDTLIVTRERRDGWNWSSMKGHAVVTVTMPRLTGAMLDGSGDLTAASTATDRFEGRLAGSGDLDIADVRAAETKLSLAGSGDVRARGKTGTAEFKLAGSGDIAAGDLIAETVSVSLAGSGDVAAHATGKATVSLAGSGDVTIAGTKDCESRKLGSGTVRCV